MKNEHLEKVARQSLNPDQVAAIEAETKVMCDNLRKMFEQLAVDHGPKFAAHAEIALHLLLIVRSLGAGLQALRQDHGDTRAVQLMTAACKTASGTAAYAVARQAVELADLTPEQAHEALKMVMDIAKLTDEVASHCTKAGDGGAS